MVKCTKCGEFKEEKQFYNDITTKTGKQAWCKACLKIYYQENRGAYNARARKWKQENREKCIERNRQYRQKNREKCSNYQKQYYEENKEKCLKVRKDYKQEHKERLAERANEYRRTRYAADVSYRLTACMSSAVYESLKKGKNGRRWEEIVGYPLEQLISCLESQFRDGMTWGNYGYAGWHIDHISPKASFEFSSPDDPGFKECWALSNLQPLWGKENMKKGARR